jgi:glutamate/tyrosine decarboxylase-like PLP-dependent enzyme
MKDLLLDAASRAAGYLDSLDHRAVSPAPEAIAELETHLAGPMPEGSTGPEAVLAFLDEYGSPATLATAGGRFFGLVIGGSLPAALAANVMTGAWDQNAFSQPLSPAAHLFEQTAARWLLDVFGLPEECSTSFVTGATMANFTGLAAARGAVLDRAGWDVEAKGLIGAPPVTIIVGGEAHPTVLKSLGMLGLGRETVIRAPVDDQGRIRVETFPSFEGPAIVCLQAGNVNTGSFDPFDELIDRAHQGGAWVHVDGAFGLWAAATEAHKHLVQGLAKADSWATDGHKWLNVPYDSGMAFVRKPEHVRRAMTVTASYLPPDVHPSPDSSRRARGVEVWAALKSLGKSGLTDLIERNCRHARMFADGFREAGYPILNDVVINQALVRFGDLEVTQKITAAIQAKGETWFGPTVWQDQPAMRISASSWATTEDDVRRSLASVLRIVERFA